MNHDWQSEGAILRCARCRIAANPAFVDVETLPVGCRPAIDAPTPASSQTAVIVISHNYGRYLAEALDSVLAQTRPAAEILVIDDASHDDTAAVARRYCQRGVKLLQVANRNVYLNRLQGLAETRAPFVIFLDADDVLPPEYIAAAETVLTSDAGIGIVTTDFDLFGDRTGRQTLRPCNLELSNYIHCAALARRAALQSVDWPARVAPGYCHEDWFLWRQIVRLGWRVAKSPVPLRYRRHATSMMATGGREYQYFQFANLALETVQIVLPLAGRAHWLPRLQRWVEQQTWPRISVLALDTGPHPELRRDVRRWLATLDCETQYLPLPPTGDVANLERRNQPETVDAVQQIMPRIYLQAVQRLNREFVFWLEDDVLPPHDAIARLMHSMNERTACVSGVVASRFEHRVIGWDWDNGCRTRAVRGRGVERIHGTGFGCLLIRRSVLQEHPLHAGGRTHNYDQEFAIDIAPTGLEWRIDWNVLCDHAGIAAESLPIAA